MTKTDKKRQRPKRVSTNVHLIHYTGRTAGDGAVHARRVFEETTRIVGGDRLGQITRAVHPADIDEKNQDRRLVKSFKSLRKEPSRALLTVLLGHGGYLHKKPKKRWKLGGPDANDKRITPAKLKSEGVRIVSPIVWIGPCNAHMAAKDWVSLTSYPKAQVILGYGDCNEDDVKLYLKPLLKEIDKLGDIPDSELVLKIPSIWFELFESKPKRGRPQNVPHGFYLYPNLPPRVSGKII